MKSINTLVFDIDGTLTDGGIIITENGFETKVFCDRDGLILRVLPVLGFYTIALTGRKSKSVEIRAKDLKFTQVFQGVSDKEKVLREFLANESIPFQNVGYIGNDLNDYLPMKMCGYRACPANATREIRELAMYVSSYNAGDGAVRDICEQLICAQGKYAKFLGLFGIT